MDGENNGKPYELDDLGVPLFLETPISPENSWKMKVPFEMVPFLGTSEFSGVYLHFLCCVVCVFCIQPL